MTSRDHKGIAYREEEREGIPHLPSGRGHKPEPDVRGTHVVCTVCYDRLMFVRRSRTAKAHWQHIGDGLAQYRSWRS